MYWKEHESCSDSLQFCEANPMSWVIESVTVGADGKDIAAIRRWLVLVLVKSKVFLNKIEYMSDISFPGADKWIGRIGKTVYKKLNNNRIKLKTSETGFCIFYKDYKAPYSYSTHCGIE